MLPTIHIITLLFYILIIFIVITTRIKINIYIVIFICIIYIIYINTKNKNDECILGNVKKINGFYGGGCFDIWHIYHLFFWVLLGLFNPNKIKLCIVISISWEVLEHVVFKLNNSCQDPICLRIEDPIINIIGYLIGSFIANRI
jgi:hypothetical protein